MSKYRCGFVTNSSSSSFIVGFTSKDELDNFKDTFPKWLRENLIEKVNADVRDNIITKEQAIAMYEEYALDEWYYTYKGKRYYELTNEERESKEYQEFLDNAREEDIQSFLKEIESIQIFAEVSYADDDAVGSCLEHEVVPNLPNTIIRFSHH